jgi:hypothetical protein
MSIERVRATASRYGYCLTIRVKLTSEGGAAMTQDALALDLGKKEACVVVERPLAIGTAVKVSSKRYSFEKRASIHSIHRDRRTGVYLLGLEFLDGAWNPLADCDCDAERE